MSDERKPFLLRMDPKLWDELQGWAEDEMRSVNGQIEFLLKRAVNERKRSAARDSESRSGGR
jgi:hypothetical protein